MITGKSVGEAGFPVASPGPHNAVAGLYFYSAGDGVDGKWFRDYDGISTIENGGQPSLSGAGQYTIPLRQRWRKIYAKAMAFSSTAGDFAKVVSITDGLDSANQIVVQTETGGVAEELADGKLIYIMLILKR